MRAAGETLYYCVNKSDRVLEKMLVTLDVDGGIASIIVAGKRVNDLSQFQKDFSIYRWNAPNYQQLSLNFASGRSLGQPDFKVTAKNVRSETIRRYTIPDGASLTDPLIITDVPVLSNVVSSKKGNKTSSTVDSFLPIKRDSKTASLAVGTSFRDSPPMFLEVRDDTASEQNPQDDLEVDESKTGSGNRGVVRFSSTSEYHHTPLWLSDNDDSRTTNDQNIEQVPASSKPKGNACFVLLCASCQTPLGKIGAAVFLLGLVALAIGSGGVLTAGLAKASYHVGATLLFTGAVTLGTAFFKACVEKAVEETVPYRIELV